MMSKIKCRECDGKTFELDYNWVNNTLEVTCECGDSVIFEIK